jgi:hypothetical protein
MIFFQMKAVVGSANSDKWIPQSFTGTIVEIGHVGVMFDHEYVKVSYICHCIHL